MTAVRAAAVWIQRPVEGHSLDGIQRRAARNLLVPRFVCAALCLVQRFGAALAHLQRNHSGSRFLAKIEERVHAFAISSPDPKRPSTSTGRYSKYAIAN